MESTDLIPTAHHLLLLYRAGLVQTLFNKGKFVHKIKFLTKRSRRGEFKIWGACYALYQDFFFFK